MKPSRPLLGAISAFLLAVPAIHAADPAKPAQVAPIGQAAPALPAVVAKVEGEDIAGAELEKNFQGFISSRQIPAEALGPVERARGYRMILDEMIKEKLIEKRSAGVKITDEQVTETFKKFTANLGSEEEVKKQIEAAGQTVASVRANIRSSMQSDQWLNAEVEKTGGVSDQDAEKFYKENTDKFQSPPQVRASHILVRVEQDAKPEVVTEKQKAAEAIAARVKKGEDFAKLAQELSEDPSAKQNSGDLDFFGKEQMVPEFSNAAFAMKKGDISEPVRSQFGYHVIKVTDRRDAETVPLEKVKPRLLSFLKGQKVEALKNDIRQKADVKILLPEPPAAAPAAPAAPAPAPK